MNSNENKSSSRCVGGLLKGKPVGSTTTHTGSSDGSLPVESQNVLDPLETLTYIAAITNKIVLGTSVIDMLFHNPVILAKRFATLDALSQGRIVAGLELDGLEMNIRFLMYRSVTEVKERMNSFKY